MKISDIVRQITDHKLQDDLRNNKGLFLCQHSKLSSADITKLRRSLKHVGATMFVTKNNFISKALKGSEHGKDILSLVQGPMALVFVKEDPIASSKVLTEFGKEKEAFQLRGGYFGDRVIESKEFKMLASIPPREVLHQQLAIAINGPVTKLAQSLNQIIAKIAYALQSIAEKKKETAAK